MVGCLRTSGAMSGVRWRVLGGSQFHGGTGGGGGKKREGRRWGQLHSAHPFGTVLPCKKSSALGRGVDVDYKGGVSCRRVDVRVCGGERGNSVGSRFRL